VWGMKDSNVGTGRPPQTHLAFQALTCTTGGFVL
jgi:hypothetical protein